ncbi:MULTISPECIES: ShlB/FhaC/HecB family hemolysin secretion/activation protein [unclassified Brevundimonas]|uniref:ShlB/FhaC/HecB family hemolysin secretion/activation protein n=1 Tax=unclassified Brevundimonas TaxID=2622653 RepID=UPI001431E006|nr:MULTISPECIES: ShlB/FhaC/HecB family hemolysin secretion/activation protein [unclassified Brevundimonas]
MRTFAALAFALACIAPSGTVSASTSAAPQARPGQEGLLIDRDRPDRRPADVAAQTRGPDIPAAAQTVEPFVLRAVSIEGSRLEAGRLEAAVTPFIGQTLTADSLARLRAAVAQAYAGSPWALPIITVDGSEAERGVLKITALEGRIDRIAITGDTEGDVDLVRRYAAALAAEHPLSRRRAERYFSLIGDIPGLKTTTRAVQGRSPETIDLGLEIERTPWEIGLGLDNRGSRTLGRTQLVGSVVRNGWLTMGDQTRMTAVAPVEVERFQYAAVSHRRPMGHDGAAVTGSLGYLRTRPPGGVEGDALSGGIVVSWPAIRGYRDNLVVSAGLDGVNSDSAVFGERIADERTRVLRASAAWSRATPRLTAGASLTLSQGVDGLGARGLPGLTDLDFAKLNARVEAVRAVGDSLRLTGAVSAQYSPDAAPASEQFALGGAEFGRGFPSALATGDSGWGARAEAAFRPRAVGGLLAGSEIYVFGDGGQTRINPRPGLAHGRLKLASAGAGARVALGRRSQIEVEAAKALTDPRPDADDWRFNFGVSTRF